MFLSQKQAHMRRQNKNEIQIQKIITCDVHLPPCDPLLARLASPQPLSPASQHHQTSASSPLPASCHTTLSRGHSEAMTSIQV